MADLESASLGIAILFSAGFGLIAYGARVLDAAGSLLACLLALLIIHSGGYLWLFLLIAFVAIGYLVTKMYWTEKREMGVAEGKSGTRGWRNVAANGGVPAIIAAMTLPAIGAAREDVALGFITAIATASADTFASELGVLSPRVYLITRPWSRVQRGVNGGVSNWGHFVALMGATIASLGGVMLLRVPLDLIWIPIAAGWVGCQIDSLLGALFEEDRGRAYGFLTKSDVNFLSIALAAFGVLVLLSL